jgi:hypothetical protein
MLALAVQAGAAPDAVFLTRGELEDEADDNAALALYLERNGYPDVAEVREHLDSGDWANQTVILYYLEAHKQLAFGKAHMWVEDIGAQRLDRNMTDEEVAALSSHPSMRTPADDQLASLEKESTDAELASSPSEVDFTSKDPADRAEAAAFRAEQAAGKVEEAAVRTERAAARAEAVVEKMIASAKR